MNEISNSKLTDVISSIIIDSANARPDLYERDGLTVREAKAFAFGILLSDTIVEGYGLGFDLISVVEAVIRTLSEMFKAVESEDGRLDEPEKVEQ